MTGVNIGLTIDEDLKLQPTIRLTNKNDASIYLSEIAINALFSADNWTTHKKFFKANNDELLGTTLSLDNQTRMIYSKVFKRKSITIKNEDVSICFYDTTCRKFKFFSHAIIAYHQYLKNQVDVIASEIPIILQFFNQYYYVSSNDEKIIKAILGDRYFNRQDIVHLELVLIGHRKFINSIEKIKQQERDNINGSNTQQD